jgi:hypothetical protein
MGQCHILLIYLMFLVVNCFYFTIILAGCDKSYVIFNVLVMWAPFTTLEFDWILINYMVVAW